MIYNEGKYEQKLDSLYLKTNVISTDNFTVFPGKVSSDPDSLLINLRSETGYLSIYNIAIATSSGDENNLNFLPLFSYQSNSMTTYTNNLMELKIKKEKFLFVAKNNYVNNETEVSKYEIKELFSFYENFVSRFDTKNILESLNNHFENNYELNWYNLKNDFSTMANNVSWYVVDNQVNDPNRIKKAIEWSEMSLKLSRNNSYYMDTLAQLYYKNGDKQKAITTQEDAIKNYKDAEVNPDTLNEMRNVLEKMKNGSYE